VCKEALPLAVRSNGKTYRLADFEKPKGDYLVMESLYADRGTSRVIHVLTPKGKEYTFSVGRRADQDLKYDDISVSRTHSEIKFEDGKWLLSDNKSKFGTLVLVKQKCPLLPKFPKSVQVGRTMFHLTLLKKGEKQNKSNDMFP